MIPAVLKLKNSNFTNIQLAYESNTNILFNTKPAMRNNYIILDGIEGCMRIYCMRHDDIH